MPGSLPNLVSSKTIKNINKTFQVGGTNRQVDWNNNWGDFYVNYIQPNLFPLIVAIFIIIFLSIRYILKRDKDIYINKKILNKHRLEKLNKLKQLKSKQYNPEIDPPKDELPEIETGQDNRNEYYNNQSNNQSNNQYDDYQYSSQLADQYNDQYLQPNITQMSDIMLGEFKERNMTKLSFDELAKVISGQ